MSLIKKAKRSEAYLKGSLSGVSGGGKSYGLLSILKGMSGDMSKVCILDTENGSINLYANRGDFSVLDFRPPFSPDRYVNAINIMIKEGFKYIGIDSASHEWDGPGGCLDIHTKMGGKFQDWSKVSPMHRAFIDAILQAPAHIICTLRRKQDYGMVEKNGRMVVEKMGTKEIQRDGFEYEMTFNLDINQEHLAVATKDRTGLFSSNVPFLITEETGIALKNWSNG